MSASLITVEVHRGRGLPTTTLVGLAGGAVRESLDRVHAACSHAGAALPARKTTINLAPARLRKQGSGLDLPIALALLAADGQLPPERLEQALVIGELALDGKVRGVPGVLPTAIAARAAGLLSILVPMTNLVEAAVLPGIEALGVESLEQALAWARGEADLCREAPPSAPQAAPNTSPRIGDVHGQAVPKRALQISAAGGHHLLLCGPPGTGKTMLARCLPGLLPALSPDRALEVSAVHSVVGGLNGRGVLVQPPFRAPHHTVTTAAMIGGGTPVRPGEISLASHGVLFLDELPEFSRRVLESLREPLEEGHVTVCRANESHRFPATFQLVAAMNPCPCGRGPGDPTCTCGEGEVVRYRRRVSGALLDRIDLFVDVDRVPLSRLVTTDATPHGPEDDVVARAHTLQRERNNGLTNARLTPRQVTAHLGAPRNLLHRIRDTADDLGLSARAWFRMLRVARTCADLAARSEVSEADFLEALSFRSRQPSV